jgi:hypothetical protein
MTWDKRSDVSDMHVEDVAATREFYERAFGLPAQLHSGGLVYFTRRFLERCEPPDHAPRVPSIASRSGLAYR